MTGQNLCAVFAVSVLGACGGDRVMSLQPPKAVCEVYQDCFTLEATPEGCCPDYETGGWHCYNFQTDKLHCGGCEESCPGICCRGSCVNERCQ